MIKDTKDCRKNGRHIYELTQQEQDMTCQEKILFDARWQT